ncbi:MAG: calcium-binding protein [Phycisphaerae bacterium]
MGASLRIFACVGVWLAFGLTAIADIPGDSDFDGDVDSADFEFFVACANGPDVPVGEPCGEITDYDLDGDADLRDFAALQRCFSGANQPANPHCASHVVRIEGACLRVIGTAADTTLALRVRAGAPTILEIDVGNDASAEFSVDRALFACIVVDARGGDDVVFIDESNGAFTDTEVTTLRGGGGADTLIGGSGAETFIGGDGDDSAFLGPGADRFIWSPGDDTDLVEGADGVDTVEVNGGSGAEDFTITANGTRVRFDRNNPAPFFLDIGTCENLLLRANGGNDTLACTGNLAALIQITADGGPGDDTLLGSNGADVLIGGDDQDFIDGNQGADTALLGAGDDVFQWDPGDGSDTVEGQSGHDVVVFNGSNGSEIFDFSANGPRLRFTRNLGSVVLDAEGIEQFDLRTLGAADVVNVNDLAGTTLAEANIDLAATFGGSVGDAQVDSITVNGTNQPDVIHVAAPAGAVEVSGLAVFVQILHSEAAFDSLVVNGLGGMDAITSDPAVAALIMLTINQ